MPEMPNGNSIKFSINFLYGFPAREILKSRDISTVKRLTKVLEKLIALESL